MSTETKYIKKNYQSEQNKNYRKERKLKKN